jgi:hypothetical protein
MKSTAAGSVYYSKVVCFEKKHRHVESAGCRKSHSRAGLKVWCTTSMHRRKGLVGSGNDYLKLVGHTR